MRFLPLMKFSDFVQVLNSARKFYTKNSYFLIINYFLQILYYRNRD
jgi:hypothetical protein